MPRRKPVQIDVERIFDAARIKQLAALLPDNLVGLDRFGYLVRLDAAIYAKSAQRPSANDLRKEIIKLEDAGSHEDFTCVGFLLDELSHENREELAPIWERRYPGSAFPTSKDLVGERGLRICDAVASICRVGGYWDVEEGHLRPSGKRSLEWRTRFRASDAEKNVEQVSAERELVTNLALTWAQVTERQPPDVVNRDLSVPFAKFVKQVFKLVGSNASAFHLINKHGERRRLPLFVDAVIWKWRNPDKGWSELSPDLGNGSLLRKRFDTWHEREACEALYSEMSQAGEPDAVISHALFVSIESTAASKTSEDKKQQREAKKLQRKTAARD